VVVKMEIAGVSEDELSVVIADDVLSITGRRDDEAEGRKIGYHQMGISYGEFAVYVKLPGPIDQEKIIARYEAGFLQVRLPKTLPRESRTVRISVTDNPVES
jgi:HSP20 family protein